MNIASVVSTIEILGKDRLSINLGDDPLTTENGSDTVMVTVLTTSILTDGQEVTISGATATGGIGAPDLNITAAIAIEDDNTFSYTATDTADADATGGGANIIVFYGDVITKVALADNGEELASQRVRRVFKGSDIGTSAGQTRHADGCLVAQFSGSRVQAISDLQ